MSEVSFYHLKRHSMEQALLRLLEKAHGAGERSVVRLGSAAEAEVMDTALWTVDPDSFLPHGAGKAGRAGDQPVYLTESRDNPAGASFLFILPGADSGNLEGYRRVFFVFDGNSEGDVKKARDIWKGLKGQGHELTYWTQNDKGGWEKK